jgi:predicted TIM-barrel fold metal-dependent hydrolase
MSTLEHTDCPYVLISTDTHAGADVHGYREYLAPEFHEQFDVWADSFVEPWSDLDGAHIRDDADPDLLVGVASFLSEVNWDSSRRMEHLEADGIVAEVIFPNTVPPFYPSSVIAAPAPTTAEEYRFRWAGVQAHNRWLAEFCQDAPGRRAGIAQVFLYDVEDAAQEIRWAKDHGLRGVLLPSDHTLHMNNLYYPHLDVLWAVCADLDMPIHRHGTIPTEPGDMAHGDASPLIGFLEQRYYFRRGLAHLIFSGAFDRFPGLTFVMTEGTCAWLPSELRTLDALHDAGGTPGTLANLFAAKAVARLQRTPSEYFSTNCYLASFFTDQDIALRDEIGIDRMMWGADYPHHEGTYPYTREALRNNFAGLPEDEVRMMTSETAAKVYDFDLDRLQVLADRIGPRPSEVDRPLGRDELPATSACPSLMPRLIEAAAATPR